MKAPVILIGLALIAPAAAQMPGMAMPAAKATCAAPFPVPGFEGWAKGSPAAQLTPGRYAELALAPAGVVKFSPPLNRPAKAGDMGGVYALTIAKTGTYRFAISPGAWIDVIGSKSERRESTAHRHGPDCSGITKIVDYGLEAGDYIVQFSATSAPKLRVMLIAP